MGTTLRKGVKKRRGGGFQNQSWGWVAFSAGTLPFGSCSCHDSAELPPGSDGGDSAVGCMPPRGTDLHGMPTAQEAMLEVIYMDTPARRPQGRAGESLGEAGRERTGIWWQPPGSQASLSQKRSRLDVVIPEFLDQKLKFQRWISLDASLGQWFKACDVPCWVDQKGVLSHGKLLLLNLWKVTLSQVKLLFKNCGVFWSLMT